MDKLLELEKLAELRDQGILSEAEFSLRKVQILKDFTPIQAKPSSWLVILMSFNWLLFLSPYFRNNPRFRAAGLLGWPSRYIIKALD